MIVRPIAVVAVETHPITAYPNGDLVQAIVSVFSCVIEGGRLESRDGESTELGFFAPDSMPNGDFVRRFHPAVFDLTRRTPAFAWDDAWLPR